MDIVERFLNYTKYDTQSAEESQTVPSTSKQLIFAEYLKKELEREGLDDVELDDIIVPELILSMPMKELCSEDCRGLCPRCGKDLNDGECGCAEEIDPRLAKLAEILDSFKTDK